ncbi:MAG: hypothetical protein CM1200mP41_05060 [Gammaproteobacteria bacterium]|nr:MAG: hypothetical protein CM1200mP41_05060 [Gammaproteobacteria bacterium]
MGSLWQSCGLVCENNGYQQWVPRKNVAVVDSVADMAGSYRFPESRLMDRMQSRSTRYRGGCCTGTKWWRSEFDRGRTYRFYGHSLVMSSNIALRKRLRNASVTRIQSNFAGFYDGTKLADQCR